MSEPWDHQPASPAGIGRGKAGIYPAGNDKREACFTGERRACASCWDDSPDGVDGVDPV